MMCPEVCKALAVLVYLLLHAGALQQFQLLL